MLLFGWSHSLLRNLLFGNLSNTLSSILLTSTVLQVNFLRWCRSKLRLEKVLNFTLFFNHSFYSSSLYYTRGCIIALLCCRSWCSCRPCSCSWASRSIYGCKFSTFFTTFRSFIIISIEIIWFKLVFGNIHWWSWLNKIFKSFIFLFWDSVFTFSSCF